MNRSQDNIIEDDEETWYAIIVLRIAIANSF